MKRRDIRHFVEKQKRDFATRRKNAVHLCKNAIHSLLLEYIKCISRVVSQHPFEYSHAPHNEVSVNDGPDIRRWTHNIII